MAGRMHHALATLLVLLSPILGHPCSFWTEPARHKGTFEEYIVFFHAFRAEMYRNPEQIGVALKPWRGISVAVQGHGHLTLAQQVADGVVFQLVCAT